MQLVVRLAKAGETRPALELLGRVVHAGKLDTGWFLLGVEFFAPLSRKHLRAILLRIGHGAGGDDEAPNPDGVAG